MLLLQSSTNDLVSTLFLGQVNQYGGFEPHSDDGKKRPVDNAKVPLQDDPGVLMFVDRDRPPQSFSQYAIQELFVHSGRKDDGLPVWDRCLWSHVNRPHFVRCIKPNTEKSPWNFVDDFVEIQLNYTGALAVVERVTLPRDAGDNAHPPRGVCSASQIRRVY